MQEAGGTVPRFALLAVIAVGMLGAVALLTYIGVRLLLASLLTLLLLLFAPVVLLAPAFGESGRATFVAWLKRLIGALAAKLIYAFFLAVVLAVAMTVARLDVGWFGVWLVQIALWWGVLIKRDELLGFATAGTAQSLRGQQSGSVLSGAYHAAQLGWMTQRIAQRAAGPMGKPVAAVGAAMGERRTARAAAVSGLASEALDAQAEHAVSAQQTAAARVVTDRQQAQRELRVIDRQLSSFDEVHAAARADNLPSPTPDADQAVLLARRSDLLQQLQDPEQLRAEQVTRRAASNQAQTGRPVVARDLAEYRDARVRDHAAELPVDDDRHLRAAGIDPAEYRAASDQEKDLLRRGVEAHLERERRLIDTAAGRDEVRFDPTTVRRRSAQERADARAERRARKIHPRPRR